MKVLIVNSFFKPDIGGGAEVLVETITKGLAARGHEVVVLATKRRGKLSVEIDENIKIYRAGIANIYWHFRRKFPNIFLRLVWYSLDWRNYKMANVVSEVIKREKPQAVICYNLAGWSVTAWDECAKKSVPVIQVAQDLYLLCPSSLMFKKGHPCKSRCAPCRLLRLSHIKNSRKLSYVVGVSHFILQKVTSVGYFEGVGSKVIYNSREVTVPSSKISVYESQNCVMGFIGTIMPAKGIEWLFQQLEKFGIKNKLLIGGTGNAEFIAYLEATYPNVVAQFLGHVDNTEFYSKIDICIVPSLWQEALGMVAIEASANRVPVIASNRGGLTEIIKDEVNGLICDPDDPDTLGWAIKRLLQDPDLWVSLSESGPGSVGHFLSDARMIDEYCHLLTIISEQSSK